jgi:reverse gyrase
MVELKHVHGYYRYSCPNCRGEDSDYRLIHKAPCEKCLDEELFNEIRGSIADLEYRDIIKTYYKILKNNKKLKRPFEKLYRFEEKLEEFEEFFSKATRGYRFWSAQRTWAKRLLKRKSFSIIAPTGMGKTMFALISSLYLYDEERRKSRHSGLNNRVDRRKIYLVFPTTPLLLQADKKLRMLAENAGFKICSEEEEGSGDNDCLKIISIHGRLPRKKREEYMKDIEKGDFDILLSTNMFMHKNYNLLLGKKYELIVMDDVDAILRSGKAIKILFYILGLSDEEINDAVEYLRLRQRLALKLSDEERREIEKRLNTLEKRIERYRRKIDTIIIVSSATGKPRGIYPKLFRILLGFEAGSRAEAIRNIVDSYLIPKTEIDELVIDLVKKLGSGGLVFVPIDKGIEYAEKLAEKLRNAGIRAEAFHAKKAVKLLEEYAAGNIDVLVGVATYYGVMVRGIDLPERVRYAIFPGIPRHKFSARLESPTPTDVLRILTILRDVLEGDEKRKVEILIGRISLRLRRLSQGALMKLREDFEKKLKGEEVEEYPLLTMLLEGLKTARELLSRSDVWERLKTRGDIALVMEEGKQYIMIPDVATYIQASGRTSRLYPGGITKGLSVLIVDDNRLLNGLIKRMRWLFEDFEMTNFEELDLGKLLKEIDEEREKVRKILRGEIEVEKTIELTKSALLIVESPNKARTIANFFGKPSVRILENGMPVYDVTTGDYVLSIIASIGHVYDLVVDDGIYNYGVRLENGRFIPVYTDIKRCNDCGYQFTAETNTCPRCGSRNISRKLDVVEALRELASEVDIVFIGTDPDTEGEKIGWDIKVLLEPYAREIKRVEFHEITRKAILNAIHNPRDFNMRLVEAQIVRRVEDRWLGFALSSKVQKYFWAYYCNTVLHPLLMKKMRKGIRIEKLPDCCAENRNLSAGRVQTPVLGYIIERWKDHNDSSKWRYVLIVNVNGSRLKFDIDSKTLSELGVESADELIGRKVIIEVVDTREETVNPPPPFTTDTLLEEASIRLGLSTTRTMELAQELFELGLITYHRTDSTRVSEAGIAIARQYLEDKYGEKYKELFKPRTWGVGGAHEAIRPTRPIDADRLAELIREGALILVRPLTRQHYALYRLIFNRFIASQMIPARVVKQVVRARLNGYERDVERVVSIVEKGFLEYYPAIIPEEEIAPGEYPITNTQVLKPPLAKYHDVIKWMKTQGIGRPSTYAKIIQTLIDRRYVDVSKKVKALIPTARGKEVYENFLMKYYSDVVNVDVTRKLEETMKNIEEGKRDYQEVLRELFNELKTKIIENEEVNKELEKLWNSYCGAGR